MNVQGKSVRSVIDLKGAFKLIMFLPKAGIYRAKMAVDLVRIAGGDESLIAEMKQTVARNKMLYQMARSELQLDGDGSEVVAAEEENGSNRRGHKRSSTEAFWQSIGPEEMEALQHCCDRVSR